MSDHEDKNLKELLKEIQGEDSGIIDLTWQILPPGSGVESPSDAEWAKFLAGREAKDAALLEEQEERAKRLFERHSDAIERNTKESLEKKAVVPKTGHFQKIQIPKNVVDAILWFGFGLGFGAGTNYSIDKLFFNTRGNCGRREHRIKSCESTRKNAAKQPILHTSAEKADHVQSTMFRMTEMILLSVFMNLAYGFMCEKVKTDRIKQQFDRKRYQGPTRKYRAQLMEKDHYNQIYSKNTGLSLDNQKTKRSANVLVINGRGKEEKNQYISSNILQENATQIISDPTGELFIRFAPYLLNKGYHVYRFNVRDFSLSSHYNPLLNAFDDSGKISDAKIKSMVELYMKYARAGKDEAERDPFWRMTEKTFMTAMLYYVLENDDIPMEEKCFHKVLEKIKKAEIVNLADKNERKSMLTLEIDSWLVKVNKTRRKVKTPFYYNHFLMVPRMTRNKVVSVTAANLRIFAAKEVDFATRYISDYDGSEYEGTDLYISFDEMVQTPSYLFLTIPEEHKEYDFLISMLYSQMYERFHELGKNMMQGKYCLGYRAEIPQFQLFDSKEEMLDFADHVSEENIIEDKYINNTKCYFIFYKNKFYKWSIDRNALVRLINDIPRMTYKCIERALELPVHVNFLWDESQDIGEIPGFLTNLSSSDKYRIGNHVILQNIAQAKTIFKDKDYETLLANMDTTIFLGSNRKEEKEEMRKLLGKSIRMLDEMKESGLDHCVVMVRDIPPVIDRKAYLEEHPKYEEFQKISRDLKEAGFNLTQYYDNTQALDSMQI